MIASPFSKCFVGAVASEWKPKQKAKPKTNQPPKNARAVLQRDGEMKSAKIRRGSI